ncbi:hypothetical protein C8P64_1966 [Christiangramia gaetbulicola]|uniref:Trypsin-like peptidase n=1 Tax=Christiangramia gaetbulicola TaxID=703340 RepID=A0A2T6AHZ5_9FLAO|nr:hypothetical protein [Christiangramia gaetbulicola]PTX43438.1 hypothetical protein C8P64_1966 [Christiangramia gaetbulicola]
MEDIYAEDLMILSSIQIFAANPDHIKPEVFGTGFILKHRDNFYLITVFHNIQYRDLSIFLETNLPPEDNTVPLVPVGNFLFFDLLKVSKDSNFEELSNLIENGGHRLDIAFSKLEKLPNLIQPGIDFGFTKVDRRSKLYLTSDSITDPDKNERYGFYGKINHRYDNYFLRMEPTLKLNLKYHHTRKEFHKFIAPEVISSKNDYEGCSGAPILDSQGRLVALACQIASGTKLVYGFSIQECLKLLDMSIDAKQI